MFLCMALCLTPIALPALAFALSVVGAFYAPVYPSDVAPTVPMSAASVDTEAPATRSAPCRVAVARAEHRAYPLPEIRAAHRAGVLGSVKVRYSGAPSYPSLDVVAF